MITDFTNENSIRFCKIEMIKFARKVAGFGLIESKTIVDAWMNAHGIDYVDDFSEIVSFSCFLGSFIQGVNVIKDGNVCPAQPMVLSREDILEY